MFLDGRSQLFPQMRGGNRTVQGQPVYMRPRLTNDTAESKTELQPLLLGGFWRSRKSWGKGMGNRNNAPKHSAVARGPRNFR